MTCQVKGEKKWFLVKSESGRYLVQSVSKEAAYLRIHDYENGADNVTDDCENFLEENDGDMDAWEKSIHEIYEDDPTEEVSKELAVELITKVVMDDDDLAILF